MTTISSFALDSAIRSYTGVETPFTENGEKIKLLKNSPFLVKRTVVKKRFGQNGQIIGWSEYTNDHNGRWVESVHYY